MEATSLSYRHTTDVLHGQALGHVDRMTRTLMQHNVTDWRECSFMKSITTSMDAVSDSLSADGDDAARVASGGALQVDPRLSTPG